GLGRSIRAKAGARSRPAPQRDPTRKAGGDAAAPGRPPARWSSHRPCLRDGGHAPGAQGALSRFADRRRLAGPRRPGCPVVREVDRANRARVRDARDSAAVTTILFPFVWALVGAGGGWLVRWGSVRLLGLRENGAGARPG